MKISQYYANKQIINPEDAVNHGFMLDIGISKTFLDKLISTP